MGTPIKVVITGAAGQIAYSLLHSIANGDVFGNDQLVDLVLLDIKFMETVLQGVVMELRDCTFPLLHAVIPTIDPMEAFVDADVALLLGAMPRREGMERKDLLKANVGIFKIQGEAMDKVAKKSIKVVVVGNPANTNAQICSKYAPSIPKENFSALTRLDQNRAQAQVSDKLNISCSDVYNCIIWGNHSSTQFPDLSYAKVKIDGKELDAVKAIQDDNWVHNDFVTTVQKRGGAVIAARKLSSAMSAATAIVHHVKDWWYGTDGKMVSMAVISDGNSYGIPEGLMYSFPVQIDSSGKYVIVDGLAIGDWQREMMDLTAKELVEERDAALKICSDESE